MQKKETLISFSFSNRPNQWESQVDDLSFTNYLSSQNQLPIRFFSFLPQALSFANPTCLFSFNFIFISDVFLKRILWTNFDTLEVFFRRVVSLVEHHVLQTKTTQTRFDRVVFVDELFGNMSLGLQRDGGRGGLT